MAIPRIGIAAVLLSFALAACLETTGGSAIVQEPVAAKKQDSSKKSPSAAAARTSAADQVRAELQSGCVTEHGGLFGGEKIARQCDCYAAAAVRNMGKDGIEFYVQYRIVPTVSGPRPEEMKKQCGIENVQPANARGRPAPPSGI